MDSVFLGREIRRVRKEIGLTQYELADGICGQSEISKIERGSVFPTMEVLGPISDRLKKPISYWFEAAISDQYYHVEKLKKEVHQLLNEHQYEVAYSISNMELEKKYLSGEHKQFFDWALAISGYKINKIWLTTCIQKIEELLNQKFFYMDTNQTMFIRNSLANLYKDAGEIKTAFTEFEKILYTNNYISNIKFFISVMFNYANSLHTVKQFEKSLEIVNRALKIAKETKELGNLGNLYYLKGECLIDLKKEHNEISECFEKALFFFKEFDRTDYIEILLTLYSQYIRK
ncbi:MAG: transcriptional activator plcR [Bacillales bacterium]|jgi:transcriptional regulator with XRE-family HTH domain|nr:transcriptional activator plcR [Bacillales bacterium]